MKLGMLLRLVVLLSATLASGRLTCHVKPPPAGQYATDTLHDAISKCSRRGGTVQLAPGVYRTAALLISGTVAIHVPRGAVIEAGDRVRLSAFRAWNSPLLLQAPLLKLDDKAGAGAFTVTK